MIAADEISNQYLAANDLTIQDITEIKDQKELDQAIEKLKVKRINTALYNQYVGSLRQIKTPEELKLLRKSVDISSVAHAEVMKAIQPGMSERELQAIFEFVHKKYGAEEEGYPPIVGAGNNGCILHYEENTNTNFGSEMVLMDVGQSITVIRPMLPALFHLPGNLQPNKKQFMILSTKPRKKSSNFAKKDQHLIR